MLEIKYISYKGFYFSKKDFNIEKIDTFDIKNLIAVSPESFQIEITPYYLKKMNILFRKRNRTVTYFRNKKEKNHE